jgi:hypothetical protein
MPNTTMTPTDRTPMNSSTHRALKYGISPRKGQVGKWTAEAGGRRGDQKNGIKLRTYVAGGASLYMYECRKEIDRVVYIENGCCRQHRRV